MGIKNGRSIFTKVPPDINDPPSCIPVHSMDKCYDLLDSVGNGSFGTVALAKSKCELDKTYKNSNVKVKIMNTLMDTAGLEHQNFVNKTNRLVAIKTMMTKMPTLNDYKRVKEIKFILAVPANKYLIQIYEIFVDNRNFQLHIVMEYMESNLYQMMKYRRKRVFSIPSLKSILGQILAGIKHIHNQKFFHRDIKPENILISPSTNYFNHQYLDDGNYKDNYVIKIADFGLSRHVNNKSPYTAYVSTRWYRSPEILLRSGFYSRPLDIWAFGCVAFEVTMFKPLFPGSNEMDQIWKVLEVLGTPYKIETVPNDLINNNNHNNYVSSKWTIPPGGKWEVAKTLAKNLNLEFPYIKGIQFDAIVRSSQLKQLTEVIKGCLRWNPNERLTAHELSEMEFFKNTPADPIFDEEIKIEEENEKKINLPTINTQQAMMFAGFDSKSMNDVKNLAFPVENQTKHQTNNCNGDMISATPPIKINSQKKKKIKTDSSSLKKKISLQDFLTESYDCQQELYETFGLNDNNHKVTEAYNSIKAAENIIMANDEFNDEMVITGSTVPVSGSYPNLSKEIEQCLSINKLEHDFDTNFEVEVEEEQAGNQKKIGNMIDESLSLNANSFSQYYEMILEQANDTSFQNENMVLNDFQNYKIENLSESIRKNFEIDEETYFKSERNDYRINDSNYKYFGYRKKPAFEKYIQPVNNKLNSMSIDDSADSTSLNISMNLQKAVPRSFVFSPMDGMNTSMPQNCSLSLKNGHQYGNVTF